MSKRVGRNVPISPFRRLVVDLMHFSGKVPSVSVDRRMNLSAVVLARQVCQPRPSWVGIFTKAFAKVAARTPDLRRAYMTIPWARLYEHPHNIATLNIARRCGDENIVVHALVRAPENRSLRELDTMIRCYQEMPLEAIGSFRNSKRLGKLPWPIRRLVWWVTLNLFGRRRCHNFGTFGITSVGAQGAGILHLVPLLTATLFYSLFDSAGELDVRLAFDHRVLDGATAATALADLEEVLHSEILQELRGMRHTGQQQAA